MTALTTTTTTTMSHLSSLMEVVHGKGEYSSKLQSLIDLPAGSVLTKIEGQTVARDKDYSTVQISEEQDISLNSDLVFANHSCRPSVVFDTSRLEVRVVNDRPLKVGDDITFFYPSSEWEMQQPFHCGCGSVECLGWIQGARFLDEDVLGRYWLNDHILRLLAARGPKGVQQ